MENYPLTGEVVNPYAVVPANGDIMPDLKRHESGNALAANSEARAIASVKAQVIMAKQFPRDPEEAMNRILRECARPTLADAAVYTFPRGKETVTGPSIRLAEVLARNFGNMTFGYEVLERRPAHGSTPGSSVIRAYAWDFETNLVSDLQFEVKRFRSTRSGGYAITDDRDIYEMEANFAARRMRACILRMIPGDVTDAAVAACRKTVSNGLVEKMSDPKTRASLVAQTVRIYGKMGVTQDDLESCLNCNVDDWTADHMLRLKEIKTSLEEGNSTLGEHFPRLAVENQNETISKEQFKKLMEASKATKMQGVVSAELKKMGIAKFADVPAVRFDEVLQMIQRIGAANAEAQPQIEEQAGALPEAPQTDGAPA